jgi:Tol biopolymer transport system component/predicted Ser/Thr protein kinase
MPLPAGARLGPYEILSPLGAGGMGEVYRARDIRLNRDVAIKVLPELFAKDPERRERFEREAQVLASLNHPHIAQIHGVEESSGTIALVMELVEGETLAERLERAAIPLDEAMPIARQIAEALEAAHDRGIIHRDLKPANVKVRPDGTVKVLDFGLAKALEAPGRLSSVDPMNSPTLSVHGATAAGVILGTAAYMSPEQARGKPVDSRTDIWAFGCVLYEMLTGGRPFNGETVTDVLAAIVTREPDWQALPAGTPPSVRHVLTRSFEKDPRNRLRDIGEARVMLSGTAAMPAVVDRRGVPRWWYGAGAAGVIAAAVAGYDFAGRDGPAAPRALITSFAQLTEQPGVEREPTISPDGKSVVYVSRTRGNSDLYLLRVGGRKAIPLTEDSDADDYAPAFSPDGARIAFRSERAGGGIFVMEATGESVKRVTDAGYDPRWSPDGTELLVADERVADPMSRALNSVMWAVNVTNGTRRRIVKGDAVGGRWSPSGRRIVYWGIQTAPQRDIAIVAADGSEAESPRWITNDAAVDWSPTWSPDGKYVYFGSSRGGTMNLWRVAVDEASGRTLAEPEPVTTPSAWSGGFEFTADGRSLVFADLDERTTIWSAGFNPQDGTLTSAPRQALHGRAINSLDLSPDGQTIVFSQRGQPWEALGVVRVDGTGWSRLTDDSSYHRLPTWSPDGTRLLFYMSRGGRMWTLRPDGSGLTEIRLPEGEAIAYPVWSPDGTRVATTSGRTPRAKEGSTTIFDVTSSPARVVDRFDGGGDIRPFSWSADGRRIAGSIRSGSRDVVGVLDLATREHRELATQASSPVWLPDSRRLIFNQGAHIVLFDMVTGQQRTLMRNDRPFDDWGRSVTVSRDGRTFAYLQFHGEGDVWLMTLGQSAK